MKKFFDFNLYKEGLRQTKIIGIVLSVIFVIGSALVSVMELLYLTNNYVNSHGLNTLNTITQISIEQLVPLLFVFMFAGPLLLAMSLFSFTNKRNNSDFYHSAPHTRICLYISFTASIMTWMISIIGLCVIISSVIYLVSPLTQISLLFIPYNFFYFLAGSLLILSVVMIAKGITGTGINNIIVSGIILYFPRFVMYLFSYKFADMTKIVDVSSTGIFFNSMYNIPAGDTFAILTSGQIGIDFIGGIVYTAVLGIIYLMLGCVFFNKRKSETAEKSAPNKIMQHVFRCLVTLPVTLIISILLTESYYDKSVIIALVFVSLIVYFGYELITTKKPKNLIKAIPVLPAVIIFNILFGSSLILTRDIMLSNIPQPKDIAGINTAFNDYFTGDFDRRTAYMMGNTENYNSLLVKNVFVNDKELKEIIYANLKNTVELVKKGKYDSVAGTEQGSGLVFTIKENSGEKITRRILLDNADYYNIKNIYLNSYDYQKQLTKLPEYNKGNNIYVGWNLNALNIKEVWDTYVSEYNNLSIEEKIYHNNTMINNLDYNNVPESMINSKVLSSGISCQGYEGVETFNSNYKVSDKTPETLNMIIKGMEKEYNKDRFFKLLDDVIANGINNRFISANVVSGGVNDNLYYNNIYENFGKLKDILAESPGNIDIKQNIYEFIISANDKSSPGESIIVNLTDQQVNDIAQYCSGYGSWQ